MNSWNQTPLPENQRDSLIHLQTVVTIMKKETPIIKKLDSGSQTIINSQT